MKNRRPTFDGHANDVWSPPKYSISTKDKKGSSFSVYEDRQTESMNDNNGSASRVQWRSTNGDVKLCPYINCVSKAKVFSLAFKALFSDGFSQDWCVTLLNGPRNKPLMPSNWIQWLVDIRSIIFTTSAARIRGPIVFSGVCLYVCQQDNSWTVRDIITKIFRVVERVDKFENGYMYVCCAGGDFTLSDDLAVSLRSLQWVGPVVAKQAHKHAYLSP